MVGDDRGGKILHYNEKADKEARAINMEVLYKWERGYVEI